MTRAKWIAAAAAGIALFATSVSAQVAPETAEASAPVQPASGATEAVQPGTQSVVTPADLERLQAQIDAMHAELESTRHSLESVEALREASEPPLRIYGFADVGLQKVWLDRESPVRFINETTAATFVLGNVNLYFDFQASDDWSVLSEIRFTNLPQGDDLAGSPGNPYQRLDATVFDRGRDLGWDDLRLGGIALERSYIQWAKYTQFAVRTGMFLTPYGIWNVDHGTPTLISLVRPVFMSHQMFPERQLGVEMFGSHHGSSWFFGYNAYVSNGRTPGSLDLTDDKMLGGRLYLTTVRPQRMTFGMSALAGSYSDQIRELTIADLDAVQSREIVAYDETGIGLDVSIDVGALRLRSEWTLRSVVYEQGKHEPTWEPGVYWADRNEWDGYLLTAYRLPWIPVEPYLYAELYRWPTPEFEALLRSSVGVNVYFNVNTQLKLQYLYGRAIDLDDFNAHPQQDLHFVAARLVRAL